MSPKKFGRLHKNPHYLLHSLLRHKACQSDNGEMVEWSITTVLKTRRAERHRGFESLSLRHLQRCESHLWFASFVFIKRKFLYINY